MPLLNVTLTTDELNDAGNFLMETAVELFIDQGHPLQDATRLAHELLNQPVMFTLPAIAEV